MNPDAQPFQPKRHKQRRPTQRSRNFQQMLRNRTLNETELQHNQMRLQPMNGSFQPNQQQHQMRGQWREIQTHHQTIINFHHQQVGGWYQQTPLPVNQTFQPGFPVTNMNPFGVGFGPNYPNPQFSQVQQFGHLPTSHPNEPHAHWPVLTPPGFEQRSSSEHSVESESGPISQTQVFMEYMLNCHKVEYQRGSTEFTNHEVTEKTGENEAIGQKMMPNETSLIEKVVDLNLVERESSNIHEDDGMASKCNERKDEEDVKLDDGKSIPRINQKLSEDVTCDSQKMTDEEEKEHLAEGQNKSAGKHVTYGQEQPENPHSETVNEAIPVADIRKKKNKKSKAEMTKKEVIRGQDKPKTSNVSISDDKMAAEKKHANLSHEDPKTIQGPSSSNARNFNSREKIYSRNSAKTKPQQQRPSQPFVTASGPTNRLVDKRVSPENPETSSWNGNSRGRASRQRQIQGPSKPLLTDKDGFQVPRHTAKWLNCSIDEAIARQQHLDAP